MPGLRTMTASCFESSACGQKRENEELWHTVPKCDFTNLLFYGRERFACEKTQLLFRPS